MKLADAFADQAISCERLDSPFMGRLLRILGANWDETTLLGQQLSTYTGDIGPSGHSLPLRVAGGLHALVLSGRDSDLKAAFPPNEPTDQTLRDATLKALEIHQEFLLNWTRLPPQTNEVRRSAALIAMAHVALDHFDRPIVLSELGASGGLNLAWDKFALQIGETRLGPETAAVTLTPDWEGPLPPNAAPRIAERAGVDLNPLDAHDPADLLRLTAYLWADQPERLARTRAAAAVLDGTVHQGDAIAWLEQRLNDAPDGHMHVIQHTVAWQYFPDDTQAYGRNLIETAGAKATPETPIAWMQMETDGDRTGAVGAALTLRLWPGDLTLNLGRADFHGRWIKWLGV